jgi:hypothetical protein
VLTACLPTCGNDSDCGGGQFCDFASGFCIPEAPTGLPLGSPCTPVGTGELDPCNGFCGALLSEHNQCQVTCTSGDTSACGDTGSGTAEGACLFPTNFTPAGDDPTGDQGYCAKLCDCDEECSTEGDRCVDDSDGVIEELWSRRGYCRPLRTGEDEALAIPVCASSSLLPESIRAD